VFSTISGKPVSRFSFGTMQFGGNADETASAAMYAACREAGVNFFDTANGYTGGASERILGGLVAGERDDIFVATKCAYTGGSREEIDAQVGESLTRLGVDTVDLLYLHRWDREVPVEVSLEALGAHVAAGRARYAGVSNYAAWQVMKARAIAREMGFDISFLQPMYNLVKRQVEVEILPMARSEGFAVCPYSPLGGGLLTGKYAGGGTGRLTADERYSTRYAPGWMREAAEALVALAAEVGVAPATLAVAWVARNPAVWGPIVSARDAEQLAPSLAAIGFAIDDALYARVSALSPAPPPATDRLEEA
jgi:aryl-alcohol dehydrogenase-like predicted oxidoreductase